MFIMLAVTFTALVQKTIALVQNTLAGNATFLVDGLQFIVAILLMVLGVLVAFSCLKKLFGREKKQKHNYKNTAPSLTLKLREGGYYNSHFTAILFLISHTHFC